MNRRGFLRALGTAATVGVVAPAALAELLAPKRTIFLPPRGGWFSLDLASGPDITTLQTPQLQSYHYQTNTRINFVLRKYGETDAQLRERMMASQRVQFRLEMPGVKPMIFEGYNADGVFEV